MAACANIPDGHPRFDAEQTHELLCFAGSVALLFAVPDWADNVGDRAIGIGKAAPGVPDPAKNSLAETDIEKVAARTVAIVICMTSPT